MLTSPRSATGSRQRTNAGTSGKQRKGIAGIKYRGPAAKPPWYPLKQILMPKKNSAMPPMTHRSALSTPVRHQKVITTSDITSTGDSQKSPRHGVTVITAAENHDGAVNIPKNAGAISLNAGF